MQLQTIRNAFRIARGRRPHKDLSTCLKIRRPERYLHSAARRRMAQGRGDVVLSLPGGRGLSA